MATILPNYVQYAAECVAHPCQKPLRLVRQVLSETGFQFVADPFAGSGTVLVAAKQLGRRAVGCEIEEPYCDIAVRRLRNTMPPLLLPEPEPPLTLALET